MWIKKSWWFTFWILCWCMQYVLIWYYSLLFTRYRSRMFLVSLYLRSIWLYLAMSPQWGWWILQALFDKIIFLDTMEATSKMNHHHSFVIDGSILWDLIAIHHLSLEVSIFLTQMDWRLRLWIIKKENGFKLMTIRFQMVTGE